MKNMYFLFLIFCFSCANIVPLTGGDKDVSPPELRSVYPENKSTLFKENIITMVFDEAIQINQAEKLFFSPYIENDVSIEAKGDELLISVDDEFKENTTYTIILNNIVKDITEGNVLSNLEYTFSTGAVIDTLYIQGTVLDALTKKAVEKVSVGLYYTESGSDSLLYKQKPDYLAISDKDGFFKFSNLADNSFTLLALEDADNNLKFSLPQEKVGFIDDPIQASSKNTTVLVFDETALSDSLTNMPAVDNDSYGRLLIDSLPNSSLIVEILHKESVIYRTTEPSLSLSIDSLSAGTYSLRIIYDENNNGKWDSGSLAQKRQAEEVEYFPKDINIRADWDVIVEWESSEL